MKNISGTKTLSMALAALMFSLILIPAGSAAIGVEEGDWIKYEFTISGAPSGTPLPQWIKIEFLSVEETTATIRVTMHMSDGTEQTNTITVDVEAGGGEFSGLSGFAIPANLEVGDSVDVTGYGTLEIGGKKTRTYAGASRTVVYASASASGTELTYYWDKQTGVLMEVSMTSMGITATVKATETNIWEAAPAALAGQWLWILVVVVIIVAMVVAGSAILLWRRRKVPLPPETAPAPTESSK